MTGPPDPDRFSYPEELQMQDDARAIRWGRVIAVVLVLLLVISGAAIALGAT